MLDEHVGVFAHAGAEAGVLGDVCALHLRRHQRGLQPGGPLHRAHGRTLDLGVVRLAGWLRRQAQERPHQLGQVGLIIAIAASRCGSVEVA